MYKYFFLLALTSSLLACGSEDGSIDKHPATGSFNETTKPKKIASKPCSKYNLKFYQGDQREFNSKAILLGSSRSDAELTINGHNITVLGFEGQAEEYINYSIYRGVKHKKEKETSGSTLATKTETQITVCFRKKVIAVKEMVEQVRARGDFSKAQYYTKQWLWIISEKDE